MDSHAISGQVLVPGSGTGHDVRAIAGLGVRVIGLDISPTAISIARSFPNVAGETYEIGDLFQLPVSWHGSFDWVVEHTCFCAIDPISRPEYVRAVAELLRPGGYYFAVFYLNPRTDYGPPFGITHAEIDELFEARFMLVEEWIPSRAFSEREGRELCQLSIRR
jgi:SAM-dependent methyltransferase